MQFRRNTCRAFTARHSSLLFTRSHKHLPHNVDGHFGTIKALMKILCVIMEAQPASRFRRTTCASHLILQIRRTQPSLLSLQPPPLLRLVSTHRDQGVTRSDTWTQMVFFHTANYKHCFFYRHSLNFSLLMVNPIHRTLLPATLLPLQTDQ